MTVVVLPRPMQKNSVCVHGQRDAHTSIEAWLVYICGQETTLIDGMVPFFTHHFEMNKEMKKRV